LTLIANVFEIINPAKAPN